MIQNIMWNLYDIQYMVLREVKPLNEKQWEQVISQLESGPTVKSIRTVNEAVEFAKKIKIV